MFLGINLRERVTPLKYTIDEDQDISSSEDENGEVFPKEKTTFEKWMMEVYSFFKLDSCNSYIFAF